MLMEMRACDLTWRFPVVRTSIEICFCQLVTALALLLGIPERKRERREEHKRTAGDSKLLFNRKGEQHISVWLGKREEIQLDHSWTWTTLRHTKKMSVFIFHDVSDLSYDPLSSSWEVKAETFSFSVFAWQTLPAWILYFEWLSLFLVNVF